jgi:hypothetical protein
MHGKKEAMMRVRIRIPAVVAIALGLAAGVFAQPAKADAPDVAALRQAMAPGKAHQQLEPLVGTFDVKVQVWVDPSQPPVESTAVSVSNWVLGKRYVQTMLSGFILEEPWSAISYAGFDNVTKRYVATYMDTGGTAMDWFTGTMSPDGKSATLTATVHDALTLEPVETEMRLRVTPDGDHVTEVWQSDGSGTPVKVLELQYTRRK